MGKTNISNHHHKLKEEDNNTNDQFQEVNDSKKLNKQWLQYIMLYVLLIQPRQFLPNLT